MLPVQASLPLNTDTRFKAFMKDEMKCKDEVVKALENYQGVTAVKSFEEFESSEWNGIAKQFLNPPMKAGTGGNLEKQSPIIITATSMKKLKAASCAVRYYTSCGYNLTVHKSHRPEYEMGLC